MSRRQIFYTVASICALYILYVLVSNYVLDPHAEAFLRHKANLVRPEPRFWLQVMYIHVGMACVAMATGFLNLMTGIHARYRKFHRVNGYVYVLAVLVVVITSGYMAPYATGGKIGSMGFNLLNMLWLAVTTTGVVHILRKRISLHRRWMMRSYAFCFTNLLIHLFTFVLNRIIGIDYVTGYLLALYVSIALILIVPEVIFRTGRRLIDKP